MSFLYLKIYHGPCNTFDSCIHKPLKLYGIRDKLRRLGFRVDLIPVEFIDYCMFQMCGHEIFRCNLQHLKFDIRPELDPVAMRALEAVMTSAVKFRRARACLWFWTALDHQMFRRSKYAPKDFWPSKNIHWITKDKCTECVINDIPKERPDDRELLTKETPT